MNSPTPTIPSSQFSGSLNTIDSICIGSGRFLRSVLVPALVAADYHPAIIQTRGRSFLEYCIKDAPAQKKHESSKIIQSWTYEVDTVQFDGRVEKTTVPFWGAGTLGSVQGKQDVMDLCKSILGSGKSTGDEGADGKPRELSKALIVGVGVTEAGLSSSSTKAMKDLYDVLEALSNRPNILQKICVINTDNVPQNGNRIQKLMYELALTDQWMQAFLVDSVIFHNTMVDRITSERTGTSGLVPRAEPTPLKALVIEDLGRNLPSIFSDARLQTECGCIIRTTPGKLNADIALKLRVANGTHTAVAHVMALTGLTETDVLSSDTKEAKLLMKYLDSFFKHQIKKGVEASKDFEATKEDAQAVYDDWRRRLIHAHFGLSTFFITQNGAAKGGIRVGPTVRDLIVSNQASKTSLTPIKCSTVFCLAAILRFLTDNMGARDVGPNGKLHIGLLDPKRKYSEQKFVENEFVTYADGLSHNLKGSWYHFRCDCEVSIWNGRSKATQTVPLPKALCLVGASNGSSGSKQPVDYEAVIKAYLCKADGGDLASVAHTLEFDLLVKAIANLYSRMVNGDAMLDILESLNLEASCESLVDGESRRCISYAGKPELPMFDTSTKKRRSE